VNCNGKGYNNECSNCSGTSYVRKDVKQSVYISKNTHNKSILRVEGLGNHGFKSVNGDLYITVMVEDSLDFKIDGIILFT
jgi:DnaJ-class molecular chaperone